MPMIHRLTNLLLPAALLGVVLDANVMIVAVDSTADNQPGHASTLRQAIALLTFTTPGAVQSQGNAL